MAVPHHIATATDIYDNPDRGGAQPDQDDILDELALYVRTAYRHALDNKDVSGIQDRIERAIYSKNRVYSPSDKAKFSDESNVLIHMGIVSHICRGAMAWIVDVLANSIDKPYTLQPTPVPELPQEVINVLVDELSQEIQEFGETPDLGGRVKEMQQIAFDHMNKLAREGVQEIERIIDDQLTQAQWRTIFVDFIDQMMYSPTAFILGPEEVSVRKLAFSNGQVIETEGVNLEPRVVSASHLVCSSDSGDLQSGEYVIITEDMNYSDMYEVKNMSGIEEEAIDYILDNFVGYHSSMLPLDDSDEVEERIQGKEQAMYRPRTVRVYKMYGKIPGRLLQDKGVSVDDPRATYESIVWVCEDLVIRTALNAYPLQKRPIFGASVEQVAGSVWGRSFFDILEDVERGANAAARSLIRNMAFASGPIGEVDVKRFSATGVAPDELEPYTLYHVDPDYTGTGQPAIRYIKIPSISAELMGIFEKFNKQAEELSGIPGYVLGQPEVAGAGRTLGGLSMLMGNAAKGIKLIITVVDKNIIEPMIEMYYEYNVLYTDLPPGIVYDAQVVAKGSNGILQKELSSGRAIELLQILMPFMQAGLVPPDGVLNLLRELINLMGFNGDEFVQDQDVLLLDQVVPSTREGTPPPALDARSAPANQAQTPSTPLNPALPANAAL